MNIRKTLFGFGIILLFIGFFLAFLPHAVHVSAGLPENSSHTKHVVFGAILIVVAIIILILTEKK